MHQDKKPMMRVAGLWKNKDKNGDTFLSGNLGSLKVLLFPNKYRNKEVTSDGKSAPDFIMYYSEREHTPIKAEDLHSSHDPFDE